ncbi:MAG: PAS domain-containing protein [Rhodospirillales bacterium]|nr:PAS domain-containing protein [Rhodospirillales bacterium]
MRFRFRLIGTEVVSRAGRDVTGAWVEEAFLPDRSGGVIDSYRCVAQTRRPHHWRITMPVAGRDHIEFERIAFPLAADGENVDMLIVIHAFFDASPEH